MAMKKQDRKKEYTDIIKLMLKRDNKEAYNRLSGMCGKDTGLFILADYDKAINKLSSNAEIKKYRGGNNEKANTCTKNN